MTVNKYGDNDATPYSIFSGMTTYILARIGGGGTKYDFLPQ